MARTICTLAIVLTAVGCRTPFEGGVVAKDGTRYSVGRVPQGWHPEGFADNDLAFVSGDRRHTIAVNATCHDLDDAPLAVLMRHLTTGFTDVKITAKRDLMLDGRAALFRHLQARLDGVPVELGLVVMKKDGCVYDFTYLSPPGRYAESEAVFQAVLSRFKTEGR